MATQATPFDVCAHTLAERWWMLAIRGAVGIIFGIISFAAPGASLVALVSIFGAYALVDGAFAIGLAVRGARSGESWGMLLFEGLIGIGAGVVTFLWPGITAYALLTVIAAWALITGVAEIAAAVRLRKQIEGEWLLALSGVLSVGFGVLLLLFPGPGVLAVVAWIGAYAFVFGALLVCLAFRLRSWMRSLDRQVHPGGKPMPA
ncbi:MAG TPA: HdeD family acid-resistance protein [Kofleriaceae bacterium]|nr:HdeD family acid-resistance protein [Kofleriaceae bacterium]